MIEKPWRIWDSWWAFFVTIHLHRRYWMQEPEVSHIHRKLVKMAAPWVPIPMAQEHCRGFQVINFSSPHRSSRASPHCVGDLGRMCMPCGPNCAVCTTGASAIPCLKGGGVLHLPPPPIFLILHGRIAVTGFRFLAGLVCSWQNFQQFWSPSPGACLMPICSCNSGDTCDKCTNSSLSCSDLWM